MKWPEPSQLFKIAAGLHAASAPAHILLGIDAVYPALNYIPKFGKNRQGAMGARNCWDYVAVSLLIGALLNWQWARTGGPASQEENAIFWLIAGMHALNGFRYAYVGLYAALIPMWVAPAASILALLKLRAFI